MLQVILKSESVVRLKDLLRSRYGKTLRIDWIKSTSSLDLIEGSHRVKDQELRIPIQVQEHYFALAVVEDIGQLSIEDHLLIVELVKLVLEPEFYNWYLGQISHNASSKLQADNVVSIFRPHELYDPQEPFDIDSYFQPTPSLESANVIFFQAQDPHLIPRLANEVHEISQRWAFLKFKDIQAQVQFPEDIKSLGSLTLVIDDVLELSPQQQETIYQYLISAQATMEPLLIIGSASKIESLEDQNLIHPGLAQVLKLQRLEVDRLPRDSKLLHDALEIMLES